MTSKTIPVKEDHKQEKQVLRLLQKRQEKSCRRDTESKKKNQYRMVTSVKAGHIRGGHAYH